MGTGMAWVQLSVLRLGFLCMAAAAAVVASGALGAVGCKRQTEGQRSANKDVPAIIEGGTERPSKLIFGLTPYLPDDAMEKEFGPLAAYLGEQVGTPVEIRFADNYAALSKMLTDYEIHLAILSPFMYVQAKRDNPGLILLATQIADGSSTYAAYVVTRDDSGIESVSELAGKRFGFVDKQSASGYLYPLAYFRSLNLEPQNFFSSTTFLGNHSLLLDAVLRQQVDGGATFSTAFRMAKMASADGKHLRILAKTGRIPFDAYCASPRLDQALVQRLRSTLLSLNTRTAAGRQVLRGLISINGFVAVGDDHYDEVRRVERWLEEEGGVGAP